MARKKKHQLEILTVNAVRLVKLECAFCDDEHEDETVENLYNSGWRTINSVEYEAIGIACPKCVKTIK